jgi:hypothetical protein
LPFITGHADGGTAQRVLHRCAPTLKLKRKPSIN